MFPFLGARRGKAAVIEVIRQIADNVQGPTASSCETNHAGRGFGGLDAALFADQCWIPTSRSACGSPISRSSGRAGSPTSASLVDTFDLVEQALGRPIHLPRMASMA